MDPCRVCLKTEDTKAMDASIYSLFSDCLGLKLESNEIVNLCWGCRSKLVEFNEFKTLAHTNAAFFLTKIKCEVELSEVPMKQLQENLEEDSLAFALPIIKHEDEPVVGAFQENEDDFRFSPIPDYDDEEEETKPEIIKPVTIKPIPKKRGKYKKKPKGTLAPIEVPDDALRCPNCLKFFETSSQIYRHMRVHEIEAGGLTCHHCGKMFSDPKAQNRKLLQLHIRHVHLKDRNERFECDICGAQFTQIGSVRVHKRFVHFGEQGDFICHICSKSYRDKYKLTNHVRYKHDNIVSKFCSDCGKGFANATSLKNHVIAMHSGEKQFACQYCGKKFASSCNKITHEKIHIEVETMFCDQCDFSSNNLLRFKNHQKRHNKKRLTYRCSHCNQEFSTYAGMKYHENKHNGLTFPCEECKNVYQSRDGLKEHIRSVHLGVNYGCPKCNQTFVRKTSVRRHLIKQHKHD